MSKSNKTYDVFVSHSSGDTEIARNVVKVCRANGLEAFSVADVPPSVELSDAVWDAMVESSALVTIVSSSEQPANLAFNVGAAWAWKKPIFVLLTDPTITHLPPILARAPVFTLGRIDDAISAIRASGEPLSDEERGRLARVYVEIGVSVDQIDT